MGLDNSPSGALMSTLEALIVYWERVQRLLDIDGDVYMGALTIVAIVKMAHGTLTMPDTVLYSAAIGCFAYSNR